MSPGPDEEVTGSDVEEGPALSPEDDVEEGPVLSPEELDIAEDERVKQIDDGRYVVSSGPAIDEESGDPALEGGTDEPAGEIEPGQADAAAAEASPEPSGASSEPIDTPDVGPGSGSTSLDERTVHQWLSTDLDESRSRYGFDITATFDGSVSQQRMVSNDVVTIFESLVMWYGQQIDRNTPVEEVLGILLMEANVPIRYPTEAVKRTMSQRGLSPEDTIGDFVAAIEDDGGLEL